QRRLTESRFAGQSSGADGVRADELGDHSSSECGAIRNHGILVPSCAQSRRQLPWHIGRYCDDFVIMCNTKKDVDEAERRVKMIFERLHLKLHPDKTKKIELSGGKQGFDFLGCHLHKRMSGRLWEREGKRVYYLHRWPS